ncbi:hypothetical protein V491_02885 [Pseudogymnoascus sp. VKM F-3775]|nr:hypothetical protein V491_02885 [Pseudogymnoascus sp. VKM F-3775]
MEQTFAEAPKPGLIPLADGLQALDSSQVPPQCVPQPSQPETAVHMDFLPTKGEHTIPEKPSDIIMELLQGPTSPARPQRPSLPDDQFPAQTQQTRLFNDPRRHKLFGEYNEVIRQNPDSHLARLGELAHYVFDNGRPARVWTAGGVGSAQVGLDPSTTSIHGRCSCTYDEADILLLTESEHAAWSRANNPPKLVVIRDPEFSRRRPAKSTDSWLREQEKRTNKKWVDVQRLNRQCNDGAAENIPLQDAIQQWRTSQESDVISLETPPMNLLNISDKTVGHWPEGLAKDYQLLFEAIDECESMIYRSLDERLVPLSEQDRGIGKTTLMLFSHSDIQKCTQFRILAHRGACSSWHIDNAGVYTFIVLESNIDSPDEKDEDVVKYWPVYPTHHMNSQNEGKARLGFSKEGINWRPIPDGKIPVIALTRGDLLIQPPGTIHAPITLTNCFFLGGMAWRKNTLPQTLNVWHYLMKNEICTNEPLPRQSQAILDFIRVAVHDAPEEHGYRESELGEFDKICDEISGMVSKCGCSKACSLSTKCSCLMQGLKCGIRCHKGSTLHHTTCTTVNMLSPASLEKKKFTKRSRLKDDEESDYTSNGTPVANTKRKKMVVEALQAKAPNSTLDAVALLPYEHLNNSPSVAGSHYTPNSSPSIKVERNSAVKSFQGNSLNATPNSMALPPNVLANNSPAAADLPKLMRPEICPRSSIGRTCDYIEGRGGNFVCKHCSAVVSLTGDDTGLSRSRASKKAYFVNENDTTRSPSIEGAVTNRRKCHDCLRDTIIVDKRGPNGPNTLCGRCATKRAKARLDQGSNNGATTPAKLLPSIEKGVSRGKECDNCHRDTITVDRNGPNGRGTLCGACAKKRSKAKREKEANGEGETQAGMGSFDKPKAASETDSGANRDTMSGSGKSETPEASRGQLRRLTEGYHCLQCKADTTTKWHRHRDSTGKGRQCDKCYRGERRIKKRESIVGSETASPSPPRENGGVVRTGIKIRLTPPASSAAKEHNADRMDRSTSKQDPPTQLQSGVLLPSFGTPPQLAQAEVAMYESKTDLTTELPAATKPQELVQTELTMSYPLQHADPQVLIDLQNFVSHEVTPEQQVENKPKVNGFMMPKLEPQTLPTFVQENADVPALKSHSLNTKPEAAADLPTTDVSTTTESSGEHTNAHSSPLSEISDGLLSPEDADPFILSSA